MCLTDGVLYCNVCVIARCHCTFTKKKVSKLSPFQLHLEPIIEDITKLLKLQTSSLELLLKSPLSATHSTCNNPRFDETRQKFVRLTFGDLLKKSCESVQDIIGKVDASWNGLLEISKKLRFYEKLSRTNVFQKVGCVKKVSFDEMFMICVELSIFQKVEEVLVSQEYSIGVIEVLEEFMEFDYLSRIKFKIIENEKIQGRFCENVTKTENGEWRKKNFS